MKKFIKNFKYYYPIDMTWTPEEQQAWIYDNLIPKSLLNVENNIELHKYIRENKNKFLNYYQQNQESFDCYVRITTPNEGPTAYELQFISKKTGKIVTTFIQEKKFELSDGISLAANNQVSKLMKKENDVTKEQSEIFDTTLPKIVRDGYVSRQEIVDLVEVIRKEKRKPSKVRHSGHFEDMKLERISAIKLTPTQDKMMNVLYKLIHDTSETYDTKSKNFYAGNETNLEIPYGGINAKSSVIRVKPTEIYTEFLGDERYSGKGISNAKKVLQELNEKKFLIQYNRKRTEIRNGEIVSVTDRIETTGSLIKIISYMEGMTNQEVERLDSKESGFREQIEEFIIAFNPLITDQINLKYVEYPSDINERTAIASGGKLKVTESIIALRTYLMRELSNKRFKFEMNKETLIELLQLKKDRKKRLEQAIEKAIEVNKSLGLIENVQTVTGARGQEKYIFTLNPEFE
jgi:hypothetical protein